MEINGTPLHPLVVHAAVVFVPLAALGAIAYVLPRWRSLVRWPTLVVTLIALVAVQVSIMTGQSLRDSRKLFLPLVATHQHYANLLRIAMLLLTVVVVVAFVTMGHVTRLVDGRDKESRVPALEKPLMVLLPLLAVVVIVLVVLTGDAGARALWQR